MGLPIKKLELNPKFLWLHDSWEPGLDVAILGASAIVGDHKEAASAFVDCIRVSLDSGFADRIENLILRVQESVARTPKLFYAAYAFQRRAQATKVFRHPFDVGYLLLRSLPPPLQDEVSAFSSKHFPEYESALQDFADRLLWGKAIGLTAVSYLVGSVVNNIGLDSLIEKLNWIDPSRHDALIQGLIYGDQRKPPKIGERDLVTWARQQLTSDGGNHKKKNAARITNGARIWAAVWIVHDGRPSKALQSGDALFTGLRSKDISELAKPFNEVYEIQFPMGPEPLPDTPFIRGNQPANMRAARFRTS